MKYRVIWSPLPDIAIALQRWLEDGWELQGGPIVIKDGDRVMVYQAIVLKVDVEEA